MKTCQEKEKPMQTPKHNNILKKETELSIEYPTDIQQETRSAKACKIAKKALKRKRTIKHRLLIVPELNSQRSHKDNWVRLGLNLTVNESGHNDAACYLEN